MNKALLVVLAVAVSSAAADRILVLVDTLATRDTHSQYFKSLSERGHKLTFKLADDQTLSLSKYGEFVYDHLLIFAPSVEEFGGSLNVAAITRFIDDGGNVLVAASSDVGDAIRELASECGFEFDDEGTAVIDHLHFDAQLDDGYHTTVVASPKHLLAAPYIVANAAKGAPVLFKGAGMISDAANPLTLEVLTADTTAYSFNPQTPINEYPHAVGKSVVLVGALQARNNARVVFTGSMAMFSDQFLNAPVSEYGANGKKAAKSGNADLVGALSKWVLKETGVIRATKVEHHKAGEKMPPPSYTIMEDAVFAIHVEQLVDGKWTAFKADDMQMEFVRIDPFVRATLKHDNNGKFAVKFRVPDVYGVYKFVVDYNRLGLTHLHSSTQVSVRPLEHTQYERHIRAATPYYASAFSMMAGLWVFSCVFAHYKEPVRARAE